MAIMVWYASVGDLAAQSLVMRRQSGWKKPGDGGRHHGKTLSKRED